MTADAEGHGQEQPKPRVVIYQGADGDWYWSLKDANHETVAQHEGYETKDGALRGWRNARAAALETAGVEYQPLRAEAE